MRPSAFFAFARFLLLLLSPFAAGGADAHDTNLASLQLHVEGGGRVRVMLYADPAYISDSAGLEGWRKEKNFEAMLRARRAALIRWLDKGFRLATPAGPCAGAAQIGLAFENMPQEVDIRRDYACPGAAREFRISYDLFLNIDKTHVAFGNIFIGEEQEAGDFLFDRVTRETTLRIAPAASAAQETGGRAAAEKTGRPAPEGTRAERPRGAGQGALVRFWHIFLLGIEHILTGYDHILFVLSLIIGAPYLRQIVKVVTAFTISHSLTLALAWFGLVDIPSWIVETAIAASIAFVAAQNIAMKRPGHRWMLAGGFGLIHGLGFATALKGLDLSGNITMTLLAFNLGVETGQLSIVLALAPALIWWRGQAWHRASAAFLSGAILAIASFWMIQRAFFS